MEGCTHAKLWYSILKEYSYWDQSGRVFSDLIQFSLFDFKSDYLNLMEMQQMLVIESEYKYNLVRAYV